MTLHELFESLSFARIEQMVSDRQEEHLSLDFKTAGAEFTSGGDKKNFAEVLSGFSNSAGGITVWGVITRKDDAGRDVAAELKKITNVARFVTRLQEFTPLVLKPANPGVIHRAFDFGDGSGVAATLIPESDAGPHMALAGHERYFKRAGDRFYRMEHFDVADMFGRRQRAVLEVEYAIKGWPSLYGPNGNKRTLQVSFSLANHGRASVAAPFARIQTVEPFEVRRYGASSKAHGDAQFEVLPENSRAMSFVAGANVLLHPKMVLPFAEVVTEFWDHEPIKPFAAAWSHAALDLPLVERSVAIEAADLAPYLDRPEAAIVGSRRDSTA
jgi:hypothetical protein